MFYGLLISVDEEHDEKHQKIHKNMFFLKSYDSWKHDKKHKKNHSVDGCGLEKNNNTLRCDSRLHVERATEQNHKQRNQSNVNVAANKKENSKTSCDKTALSTRDQQYSIPRAMT